MRPAVSTAGLVFVCHNYLRTFMLTKMIIMNIKAKPEGVQLLQVKKYWVNVWVDKVKYMYTEYTCDKVLISYEVRKKDVLVKDENVIKVIVDYLRRENYVTSQN